MPVVLHAPNAAAYREAIAGAHYSNMIESLLEYGADVRKNMVTTADMAMLGAKLVEVTQNLAKTGDELCQHMAVVDQVGGDRS